VWEQIAPLLDMAMDSLSERDRNVLVLRFFEEKTLAQVGLTIGSTEDAARMTVNRALEKLRTAFARSGLKLTAAAIAGARWQTRCKRLPPDFVQAFPPLQPFPGLQLAHA
jgi:hypothetical protein